jgi:hypothetical protein
MSLPSAIGTLLGSRKVEYKWENPRKSIGERLHFDGLSKKYTCWWAVGPARKLYDEELLPSIKEYLNSCGSVDDCTVFLSFCMIGKDEETASPKVIISCPKRDIRRYLRDLVQRSSIMSSDQFRGIGLIDSSVPPGYPPRLLAGHLAPTTHDSDSQDRKSVSTVDVFTTTAVIGLGDRLIIPSKPGSSGPIRYATAGPIFYWKNKAYCLTVAHVLNDHGGDNSRPTTPECDGLSSSDSDTDEDGEEELMSQGSLTSEEDIGCGIMSPMQWEQDSSSASETIPALRNVPRHRFPSREVMQQQESICQGEDDSLSVPDTSSPLDKIGSLVITESNTTLDYALVEITGNTTQFPNILCLSSRISGCLPLSGIAEIGSNIVKISTVTASSGPLHGTLHPSPSHARLPNSTRFQKVYNISLEGLINDGDCGSCVVDSENGRLYGHIIAGSPGTGVAWMVPATEVIEDIQRRWGGKPTIVTGQPQKDMAPDTTKTETAPLTPDLINMTSDEETPETPQSSMFVRITSDAFESRLKTPIDTHSEGFEDASYAASVSTVESAASTATPLYSTPELRSAAEELLEFIANDSVLKPLYLGAMDDRRIDAERFTRNLYRLLKKYGKDLKSEAKTVLHFKAASFVQSQARFIAERVTQLFSPANTQSPMLDFGRAEQVSRFLRSLDGTSFSPLSDSEDDGAIEENDMSTLENVKDFIVSGRALASLRNGLTAFIVDSQPRFKTGWNPKDIITDLQWDQAGIIGQEMSESKEERNITLPSPSWSSGRISTEKSQDVHGTGIPTSYSVRGNRAESFHSQDKDAGPVESSYSTAPALYSTTTAG